MRSLFRPLTIGLAALLATSTMAQYPYTIALSGTVGNCYPGQVVTVQTVQGTLPSISWTIPVDSTTCTYSVFVPVSNQPAWLMVSTLCGGAVVTGSDSSQFNFIGDTAISQINFSCGGFLLDCQGIPNGPNMPGTPCESYPGSGVWGLYDATCYCDTLNANTYDCLQILNGPNMPGTACNDNDTNTVNDTWSANCVCAGVPPSNCQAAFSVSQIGPWAMMATNQSTGMAPMTYLWWMPDGTTSTQANPIYTFAVPGTYGICLTITTANACTSVTCDTVFVDSAGTITTLPSFFDCLGIPNGPNMPGTACNDGNFLTVNDTWDANCNCAGTIGGTLDCNGVLNGPDMPGTACTYYINGAAYTGLWSPNCVCQDSLNTFDCLGIPGGTNLPGTACNDGDSLTVNDLWNANCICAGVFLNMYDCNGVLNGPDMPGAPCNDGDTLTLNDMWDANCDCTGSISSPCNADFWVLQAYTIDSLNGGVPVPTPNELWVWNLSSGGSGTYSFLWSFGDGTSSTDPFPTHTYANGGPYILCLTLDDGAGCTDTYCDSVSVDSNGLYTGFAGNDNQRSGFTINVQNQLGTGVAEVTSEGTITTWPNPVTNELNVALVGDLKGQVDITITDMNGRVVRKEVKTLASGRNQLLIPTPALVPGMYMLRLSNGHATMAQRFVKVN